MRLFRRPSNLSLTHRKNLWVNAKETVMEIMNAQTVSFATSVIPSTQFLDAMGEKAVVDIQTTVFDPYQQALHPTLLFLPCQVYQSSHLFNQHSAPHPRLTASLRNSDYACTGIKVITGKRHEKRHSGAGNVVAGARTVISFRLITVETPITFNTTEKMIRIDLPVIRAFV